MGEAVFFPLAGAPTLGDVAAWCGATLGDGADPSRPIRGVGPLDRAGASDLAFFDNPKYLDQLASTGAAACLLEARFAGRVPAACAPLAVAAPYRAFADVLARMYPSAVRPLSMFEATGISPGATVHATARLEADVTIDPGAVVGPRVEIGAGTSVAANAVIGPDVRIGRGCSIGPGASVTHALLGNRVILHAGARVGQDGFGYAMGPGGHRKVPQVGRVILQDDVEVGANTTIDRGANRDTVVGEGTKIDNLVQIAHNVTIGRHCVIVSQVGISGSTEIGDYVAIGGQAGLTGHLKIGAGAKIAASAGLMNDVPAGETWGGAPAQPIRAFWREMGALRKLAGKAGRAGKGEAER